MKRRNGYPLKNNCRIVVCRTISSKRQIDNELQCRITSVTSFVTPHFGTIYIKIHLSKVPKFDKNPLVPPLHPLLGAHIILAENCPFTPILLPAAGGNNLRDLLDFACVASRRFILRTNQIREAIDAKRLILSH